MATWSLDSILTDLVEGNGDNPDLLSAVSALRKYLASGNIESAVCEAMAVQFFYDKPIFETGRKVREAASLGGRKRGSKDARNIEMATKFLERRPQSTCSDTALKERVGADFRLSRSQSIQAINNID